MINLLITILALTGAITWLVMIAILIYIWMDK
jgi:hypothetical protein